MCERLFSDRKGKNSLFTNEEKLELAELVSKRKEEYDAEVARNVGKFKHDSKRKKHVPIKPTVKRRSVKRRICKMQNNGDSMRIYRITE